MSPPRRFRFGTTPNEHLTLAGLRSRASRILLHLEDLPSRDDVLVVVSLGNRRASQFVLAAGAVRSGLRDQLAQLRDLITHQQEQTL